MAFGSEGMSLGSGGGMTDVCLEHIQDVLAPLVGGVHHGGHDSVSTRACLRAKAAAFLAIDDRIAQRTVRGIVCCVCVASCVSAIWWRQMRRIISMAAEPIIMMPTRNLPRTGPL